MTKRILFVETLSNGWKLYGKTGTGNPLKSDGTCDPNRSIGWFVGWVQKDHRTLVFAHYIEDQKKQNMSAGPRARGEAKQKLLKLIQQNI